MFGWFGRKSPPPFPEARIFNEPNLIRRIAGLPKLSRVAFAAACASRMIKGCQDARRELNLPDFLGLETALSDLWSFVLGGPGRDWLALSEQLVAEIPHEDEMNTAAHAVIDNALAAAAYAVSTAISFEARQAVFCARRAYEAMDGHAHEALDFTIYTPEIEQALLRHPIVQQELERQARDLRELESAGSVARLRARVGSESAFG